uniref:Ribosomal protein S1 n=1 Tax=Taenioma perpusillum TaxID=210852 RepID=A0A1Z1MSB4_9FLOR|nr:ribosomal protein S1 [Taenioma perpusillum]ARW68594.1 ribosomal protein S1 [Taenioma perpusillum]
MNKKPQYKQKKFTNILEKYRYNLQTGNIVAGTIIYKESNGFLVIIGDQLSGYLPEEEISIDILNNVNTLINITRDFFLIKYNTYLKQYILSIKRLEYIRSWTRIRQIKDENIIFKLKIKYTNKGGFLTYLENIQAFIPKSHMSIGKKYEQYILCKLLTINENKNQLVLSNKSAILEISPHKFRIGEIIYGYVIQIKSYGLFIKIYDLIALLHISNITSKYINNIYHFFYTGELIKIKIIYIDNKQGRLSVSTINIKR